MKKGMFLTLFAAVSVIWLLSCSTSKEVKKQVTKEEVTQAINSDNWKFTANVAMSQYGRTRYLNGEYDVKCTKELVDVYLPYFGRAYSAPLGSQNPMQFKTSKFSYNKTEDRTGSWVITIKPQDFNEVQSMTFTFFESGNAQLNVLLTNRSPMNFTGFVGTMK